MPWSQGWVKITLEGPKSNIRGGYGSMVGSEVSSGFPLALVGADLES